MPGSRRSSKSPGKMSTIKRASMLSMMPMEIICARRISMSKMNFRKYTKDAANATAQPMPTSTPSAVSSSVFIRTRVIFLRKAMSRKSSGLYLDLNHRITTETPMSPRRAPSPAMIPIPIQGAIPANRKPKSKKRRPRCSSSGLGSSPFGRTNHRESLAKELSLLAKKSLHSTAGHKNVAKTLRCQRRKPLRCPGPSRRHHTVMRSLTSFGKPRAEKYAKTVMPKPAHGKRFDNQIVAYSKLNLMRKSSSLSIAASVSLKICSELMKSQQHRLIANLGSPMGQQCPSSPKLRLQALCVTQTESPIKLVAPVS
mmetsp:Transcript_26596/g.62266  ORF Transcript_26596/g.62266 Transcript_26596/m.62266 type:complete len:312 (-) Transcript_26596:705-1640(-)